MVKLSDASKKIQIKYIAILFVIYGLYGLYSTLDSFRFIDSIPGTTDTKVIFLPGTKMYLTESMPLDMYKSILIAIGIVSSLLIIEGGILLSNKINKSSIWLGIILTAIMALNFPTGTVIAIIIFMLYSTLWQKK